MIFSWGLAAATLHTHAWCGDMSCYRISHVLLWLCQAWQGHASLLLPNHGPLLQHLHGAETFMRCCTGQRDTSAPSLALWPILQDSLWPVISLYNANTDLAGSKIQSQRHWMTACTSQVSVQAGCDQHSLVHRHCVVPAGAQARSVKAAGDA